MRNAPGSIMFLLRCYALPRPNGPNSVPLPHATSPAMSEWLTKFKRQGLIQPDVTIENLIQGKLTLNYLTENGVAFVKAICDLDPNNSEEK